MSEFNVQNITQCIYDQFTDYGRVELAPEFLYSVSDIIDIHNLDQYPAAVLDVLRAICFISMNESHLVAAQFEPDEGIRELATHILEQNSGFMGELLQELQEHCSNMPENLANEIECMCIDG